MQLCLDKSLGSVGVLFNSMYSGDATTYDLKVGLFLGIFIVMVLTLLFLLGSSKILKLIEKTGNKVMMRLMGLIVMVIAVKLLIAGLKPIITEIATTILYITNAFVLSSL